MSIASRGRLTALTAAHAVNDVHQGAVPALLPFLVAERHYSLTAAAGITLAATFLSSVAQPVFGLLTDRKRLGWTVPAGVAVAGLGLGLAVLAPSYPVTWAAIALSGLGVAAFHPEASRQARQAAGGTARGLSVFALGGNAGFAVAPVFVAAVMALGGLPVGWLLGVPALLTAALLAGGRRRATATAVTPIPGDDRPDDWRSFRWLTSMVVVRSICFFGVSSFLALLLMRRYGATEAVGNAALTVFMATGAVGTLIGGALADRWGRLRVIRYGYAAALPGFVVLLSAPSVPVAMAAAVLLGLGLYVPFSVQVTLGQEYLPRRVGTASGVTLGLAVSIGGMVAPVLGLIADRAGLGAAFAVLAVLPVVALVLSTRLADPQRVSGTRHPGAPTARFRRGPVGNSRADRNG